MTAQDQVFLQYVKATVLLYINSLSGSKLVRMLATLQSPAGRGNRSWAHNAMIFKTRAASALPQGIVRIQMAEAHSRISD